MATLEEVCSMIDEVLQLNGRIELEEDTALLGNLPELESMVIAQLAAQMEERFDIVVEDDDINGDTFETVGSLMEYINEAS